MFSYDLLSLIQNGLAFKAVVKEGFGEYASPTDRGFVWGTEGIVKARCYRTKPWDEDKLFGRLPSIDARGESWHKDEEIPHDECTCGIYGTYSHKDAMPYEDEELQSIMLLIEAHGTTNYYRYGFRSAEARVIAVCGMIKAFSDGTACDYFKVPFVSIPLAGVIMDIQNTKIAQDEEFDYTPRYASVDLCKEAVTAIRANSPPIEGIAENEPYDAYKKEVWPFK
jgi:hypothetical protein